MEISCGFGCEWWHRKEFIDEEILLTAVHFRDAGYTLRDLLHCFPEPDHPLRQHPFKTSFTLFDIQLKDAGYEAKDFKDAGYSVFKLSEHYGRENDWAKVGAYFTASELASAGYSASELLAAGFAESEILSAGCSNRELENARLLKQRRLI